MPADETTQQVLDSTQYTVDSIRRYEAVFGEDFVSPGGHAMAVELIAQLNLKPASRVLDVGCGLGGSAFVMAREFDLIADGIDLSKNMLDMAIEKLSVYKLAGRVRLDPGDCLELNRPGYYDAIYSRDVFLHIKDKPRLFSVLHASLKAGGKLLFSDYCCAAKPWADSFTNYVKERDYSLHTLPEYSRLISDAGFTRVQSVNMTNRFVEILLDDLNNIDNLDQPVAVRDELKHSWLGKLERAKSGDHRWALFSALKAP